MCDATKCLKKLFKGRQKLITSGIEQTIAFNIIDLRHENNTATQDIIDYIQSKADLNKKTVKRILSGHFDNYHPVDVLIVLKLTAQYFNTTLDYILGLTDKPY